MSAYDARSLEHAARAESPIGKSVTEFLLKNPPKVAAAVIDEPVKSTVDEWNERCIQDFGQKVLLAAVKNVPRWERMTWQQRHEHLKTQREMQEWV